MKRYIPIYENNVPITKENIDDVLEKVASMKSGKQKKILIDLQGGRDPITKEKMQSNDKSIASKIKKEPIVISNTSTDIAKKYTSEQRLALQKSHIIKVNEFNRSLSHGEK